MANMETPRSPSVQSFASADTVSIAFTSTPGSPAMPPVSDDAAARAMHEATDVAAQPHRFYLDVRSLKLKLDDDTFYHVHRYFFERHAPRFAEQYLCGETPDIIEVHDVLSVDFQRFLDLGVCDIRTVDEWSSVLRLATKWSVSSLRDVAMREIGALRPSPIDTIVIAREFGLGQTWLVPAFVALCKSSEPLGFEDAERLGLRTAIEIGRLRELYLRSGESYDVDTAVRASAVLLSSGANDADSGSASQLTLAPSTAIPASDFSPMPSVPPTPLAGHQLGPALHFDQGPPSRLDDDDNPADLAMLAGERIQAQLIVHGTTDHHGIYKNLFALRIAKRLVTERSSAAIRQRDWRQMWLGLNGYLDDGSAYNVHRSFFAAHSPKFAAEFLCNSHAEVVRLPEISSVDFECFLSMIYPIAIGEFDVHTVAEWSSVLRLATKWSFDRLRTLALPIATAVDKIVLAREFDFGDAWIEPALKALCAAPGWLEYEEAERLGLRTVFEIGRARERLRKTAVSIPDKPEAKKAGSVKVKTSVAATVGHSVLPCPRPTVPITPKDRLPVGA
ncbi:hypothetical protein FB107DRAFT_270616 [Schizophyllum commune]